MYLIIAILFCTILYHNRIRNTNSNNLTTPLLYDENENPKHDEENQLNNSVVITSDKIVGYTSSDYTACLSQPIKTQYTKNAAYYVCDQDGNIIDLEIKK